MKSSRVLMKGYLAPYFSWESIIQSHLMVNCVVLDFKVKKLCNVCPDENGQSLGCQGNHTLRGLPSFLETAAASLGDARLVLGKSQTLLHLLESEVSERTGAQL